MLNDSLALGKQNIVKSSIAANLPLLIYYNVWTKCRQSPLLVHYYACTQCSQYSPTCLLLCMDPMQPISPYLSINTHVPNIPLHLCIITHRLNTAKPPLLVYYYTCVMHIVPLHCKRCHIAVHFE